MGKLSTEAKTLAYLRAQGIICDRMSYWKGAITGEKAQEGQKKYHRKGARYDPFGFIDVEALYPGYVLAIQSTTLKCISARKKKILTVCRDKALAWLRSGGRIEVWGWHRMPKLKKDGSPGKRKIWAPKISPLTMQDL